MRRCVSVRLLPHSRGRQISALAVCHCRGAGEQPPTLKGGRSGFYVKYIEVKNPLAENIENVRRRIAEAALRAGRRPKEITLVAVSKTVPPALIKAAHEAGLSDFGENRVQEAAAKMRALSGPAESGGAADIKWHFIGHLQTNKARAAIEMGFELIHTIDSIKLLNILEEQAEKAGKSQRALVEVKLSEEPSKHGVQSEEGFYELLRASRKMGHIKIEGLMGMPPYFTDARKARPYFARLGALRQKAEDEGFHLPHLSMGMSHDFEVAIEEGATLVRIGTAIFGGRAG
ncbi:MAG: YggS family pyridoxal phosphate-dependent enzyme [Nitrospiraceae bacterium]|nr:YggS family pyridoxal phosphate-dependent enzyme [Nitrospiraceae bacterium]